jgi:hypothetical protein
VIERWFIIYVALIERWLIIHVARIAGKENTSLTYNRLSHRLTLFTSYTIDASEFHDKSNKLIGFTSMLKLHVIGNASGYFSKDRFDVS